jgi:hypothetical protein
MTMEQTALPIKWAETESHFFAETQIGEKVVTFPFVDAIKYHTINIWIGE